MGRANFKRGEPDSATKTPPRPASVEIVQEEEEENALEKGHVKDAVCCRCSASRTFFFPF